MWHASLVDGFASVLLGQIHVCLQLHQDAEALVVPGVLEVRCGMYLHAQQIRNNIIFFTNKVPPCCVAMQYDHVHVQCPSCSCRAKHALYSDCKFLEHHSHVRCLIVLAKQS